MSETTEGIHFEIEHWPGYSHRSVARNNPHWHAHTEYCCDEANHYGTLEEASTEAAKLLNADGAFQKVRVLEVFTRRTVVQGECA